MTPRLIDDLYRHLGTVGQRKPATVLRLHTLLRAAFAQEVRWGLVDRNPVDRATPPRVHRPEIKPPAAGGGRSARCSGTTSTSTPTPSKSSSGGPCSRAHHVFVLVEAWMARLGFDVWIARR